MKTFSLPCWFLLAFLDFKRCKTIKSILIIWTDQRKHPINWFIQSKFLEQKTKDKARSGSVLHKLQFYHHCLQFIFFLPAFRNNNDNIVLIPSEYIIDALTFISAGISIYPALTYGGLWYAVFLQWISAEHFFPITDKRDTYILFYERRFFIKNFRTELKSFRAHDERFTDSYQLNNKE